MTNKKIICLVSTLAGTMACMQAQAAGFQLIENNASGQGNAYAGAAAIAEDASTVWFNPAGMMRLKKTETLVAGHFINPSSEFANNGSVFNDGSSTPLTGGNDDGGSPALVANFYHVADVDKQMKWGVGITTPFGLATVYDDQWVGRYHAVESDLRTININPSIAYKVDDKLSVGGGINVMLADVIFTNAIDFGSLLGAPGAVDGFADLEADNFGSLSIGFNLGLLYDVSKATRIGVAYRSEIDIEVEGEAVFTVPTAAAPVQSTGAFTNSALEAEVTLPQALSFSVAHEVDNMTWLADVTWTGWSSFEELRIRYANPAQPDSVTTENWEDSLRYSIGVDMKIDDKTTYRAGIAYDETPVPNDALRTPRVPDNSRTWISVGGTWVMDKNLTLDVGYSHLFISDTRINNQFESSQAPLNHTLTGTYSATVDILSTQIRWYH